LSVYRQIDLILLSLDELKDAIVAMMMRKEEVEEQMKYVSHIHLRVFSFTQFYSTAWIHGFFDCFYVGFGWFYWCRIEPKVRHATIEHF